MLYLHGIVSVDTLPVVLGLQAVFSKDSTKTVYTLGSCKNTAEMISNLHSALEQERSMQPAALELAAWNLSHSLWPALVAMCIREGRLPPKQLLHELERKTSNSYAFVCLERIYTQGAFISPPPLHHCLNQWLPGDAPITDEDAGGLLELTSSDDLPAHWDNTLASQLSRLVAVTEAYYA